MGSSTTSFLFKILFVCLAIDIARKYFEKPKTPLKPAKTENKKVKPKKKVLEEEEDKYKNPLENEEINVTLDDEFAKPGIKKQKKSKEEDNEDEEDEEYTLTITYDKKSFQKYFSSLRDDIIGNFTSVTIREEEYPIPKMKKMFGKFTFVSQMGVSLLIFVGQKFRDKLTFIPSSVFDGIEKNKWVILIGNFLFHRWLNGKLNSTGAFEITFEGKTLFSKLRSNRLPKESDIHKKLNQILNKKQSKKGKKKKQDDDEDDDDEGL